jgi:outer membrane protein assembly factor BamB
MALTLVAGAATAGADLRPAGEVSADTTSVTPSETWRTQVDTYFQPAQTLAGDGTVYSINNGTVDALDAATGDRQWEKRFPGQFLGGLVDSDGRLYVSGDGFLAALEQNTGDERWNKSLDGTPVRISSGTVYVDGGQTVKALDAQDGSVMWNESTTTGASVQGVSDGVVVVRKTVRVQFGSPTFQTQLRGLDASSGAERWSTRIPSDRVTTIVARGTVYSTVGANVSTFDVASGQPLDNVTLDGRVPRTVLPADGYFYGTATVDGQDFLLGYDAQTGQQVANVTSTAGASGNLGFPFVTDDRVYILDSDAGLRVLDASDGTQLGVGGPAEIGVPFVVDGAAFYSTSVGGGESGHATVRVDVDGSAPDTGGGSGDGDGGSGDGGAGEFLSVDAATSTVTQGGETELAYTVSNPTGSAQTLLLEFPSLPANVSVASVEGDVSQDLLGSTPPGVITTQLSPGASTTLRATVAADGNASTGDRDLTARATISSDGTTLRNTTTTTLSVSELDPLAARFGGGDNRIGNLDVLQAVNAANSGGQIGGETVSNLDVLQLVNRANQP